MDNYIEQITKAQVNKSLAMAYIIPQSRITQVYKSIYALSQGTLFPELDKPFLGEREVKNNG